jgi:hexosaminidase
MPNLIPLPSSFEPAPGSYRLTPEAVIRLSPGTPELQLVGRHLASCLAPAAGRDLPVVPAAGPAPTGSLILTTGEAEAALGQEGYLLRVEPERVTLRAAALAGLFHAVQTLRQLLPAGLRNPRPGEWTIDCCTVRDAPRFAWRGMMLDVARHFFGVAQVRRLIDQMASYKLNVLHLHLTDDQGWRLMIESWPRLAEYGGGSAANGDPGGYYSQQDYRDIVAYAAGRHIMIVPEVDMPGHTHAALAAYPELKGTTQFEGLYSGTKVGFSSFAIREEITYRLIEQVLAEIAALTPGPYLHVGGDEALSTPEAEYVYFVERLQGIVRGVGKQCLAWEEVARGELLPDTLVQYWWQEQWARKAAESGNKLIMSPASRAYMDMKYDPQTRLGQDWTRRYIDVRDGYEWDPATAVEGVTEDSILGVEAPLWTETVVTGEDLDYMTFPRLPGYAEIGWTPQSARSWKDYRLRLAAHGPRMEAMGIRFYRSPQVRWKKERIHKDTRRNTKSE